MRNVATDHNMTGVSYSTVRNYIVSLRGTTRSPRRTGSDSLTPAPSARPQEQTR